MIAIIQLLIFGFVPVAAAESWQICGDTATSYIADSRYHANLLALLSAALANNASANPYLFAAGCIGAAPNTVYGLALCRGDTTARACRTCIATAFRAAQKRCPHGEDATIFVPACRLSFSGENILHPDDYSQIVDGVINTMNTTDTTNAEPVLPGWDPSSAESIGNITEIIGKLLQGTARHAAYRSGGSMFATGRMDVGRSSFPVLYSMAQCVPALTHRDCSSCLEVLSFMATDHFAGKQGGRVLALWCNLRYDTAPFYRGNPMVTVLPPVGAVVSGPETQLTVPSQKHKRFTRRHRTGSQYVAKMNTKEVEALVLELEGTSSEFTIFDFTQVLEATANFSEENKLGQGGFGTVYKGRFPDGLEIAVKRLAPHSGQGFIEYKNEVEIIAKLQHTNLVRLLGCCSQGEEKILIYEYLPNKSLDFFIFDEARRYLLDWNRRLGVIEGIAQGLLYLHKHSRLHVIHRDLKASNILLDHEMNPKISDFGLAKIFSTNDIEGNTQRIAGTYGYMAPEYASSGLFSIKSDVFSFGVLTLEIVSGKKSSSCHQYGDFINLLRHAWQLWKDEKWLQLVDTSVVAECHTLEMMRCINIALLCVQENAADRPTMSDVVAMLSCESMTLLEPKHPAYFHVRVTDEDAPTVSESACWN
ncbi:hypothetical protein ACP70R_041827 [Stipagrostis hirtigluma subsp. patula]